MIEAIFSANAIVVGGPGGQSGIGECSGCGGGNLRKGCARRSLATLD